KATADRPKYDWGANKLCSHSSCRIRRLIQWNEFGEFNSEPNAVQGRLWRWHVCKCSDATSNRIQGQEPLRANSMMRNTAGFKKEGMSKILCDNVISLDRYRDTKK
ncbi:hypothetical protein KIL84_013551, partial [Mauremys mutica]